MHAWVRTYKPVCACVCAGLRVCVCVCVCDGKNEGKRRREEKIWRENERQEEEKAACPIAWGADCSKRRQCVENGGESAEEENCEYEDEDSGGGDAHHYDEFEVTWDIQLRHARAVPDWNVSSGGHCAYMQMSRDPAVSASHRLNTTLCTQEGEGNTESRFACTAGCSAASC
ncbi:hypothetical protein FACS189472_12500 [Alphaproteobacteria bacterium]|nr:hypothetical protein FACS189472_12500 [Alphaproteobacteria bacterium]